MGSKVAVADVFVPKTLLDEMVRGSYEQIVVELTEAVEESDLFGGEKAQLLATFSGYALAATPTGKFFRVRYATKGGVSLSEAKQVDLPVVRREEVGGYAKKTARKLVESMFSGDEQQARNHLHDIEALLIAGVKVTPDGVFEEIRGLVASSKRWMMFVEREGKEVLGDDLPKVEAAYSKPRFALLLKGEYDPTKVSEYRDIAVGSVTEMKAKFEKIAGLVEKVAKSSFTLKPEFRRVGSDHDVRGFVEFLRDFAPDIRCLVDGMVAFDGVLPDAPLEMVAAAHDLMAEGTREYELAGAVVEKFSTMFEAA